MVELLTVSCMFGELTRTDRQIAAVTALAIVAMAALAFAPTFVSGGLTVGAATGVIDGTSAAVVGVANEVGASLIAASVATGGAFAAMTTAVAV